MTKEKMRVTCAGIFLGQRASKENQVTEEGWGQVVGVIKWKVEF